MMLLSGFVVPLLPIFFLVPFHVFMSIASPEDDALPSPSVACNNCIICPYPCHGLPPCPPLPPPAAYPVYGAPPPPPPPVQGNCPPGQVVSCCPTSSIPPPYPYGTHRPPPPPLVYEPYESPSASNTVPSLPVCLIMTLLLLFQLSLLLD